MRVTGASSRYFIQQVVKLIWHKAASPPLMDGSVVFANQVAPMCTPSNTCLLGPSRVHIPNGISIGSAVFAGLTILLWQTDRPTDHATPTVTIGSTYVVLWCVLKLYDMIVHGLWPTYMTRTGLYGMGDRLRAGKPPRFVTSHSGRLSLLPSAEREMSTGQSAAGV